jgi:hypothetical protein
MVYDRPSVIGHGLCLWDEAEISEYDLESVALCHCD